MTSPLTVRCMSVTSSGRSSTSTTMRWASGLLAVIALAMACRMSVLPALGGRDDQAALALADRRDQVDDPRGQDVRLGLEAQPLLRVQRRQLAELDAACGPPPGVMPLTVSSRTSALNFCRALAPAARPRAAARRRR